MPSLRRPIIAVVGAAMLFGTAGTTQELGPDSATPLGVAAARIAIGAATLWAVVGLTTRRSSGAPAVAGIGASLRASRALVLIGGVGVALYTPLFLAATDRAGVAVATVVAIGAGPVFAGALEWAWHGRRPSSAWALGTAVSIIGGIALVGGADAPGKRVDAVGVMLALLSGLGYAMYSITAKTSMERGMAPTLALAAPFGLGALGLMLAASTQPLGWLGTGSGFAMAMYLGVFATGIAYVLFGFGLDRLTAATTVTLVLAEPLTAVVLAAVVLDEAIGSVGWIGIGVVLIGLFIVGRSAAPSAQPLPI